MQDGAVLSPSMERATRSPQSRHRKLRLMEATQHVSPASDRLLVENMAAQVAATQSSVDQTEAVNACIRVLRNVKNSVHLRALAARALGLLMLESRALADRLRLETEGLVDALLQIVGYCRRSRTQTADTRRVHVNCCLVISLLMQAPSQQHLQLVVSLDSDLLVLHPQPTERESANLLLTVAGRPESGDITRPMDDDDNGVLFGAGSINPLVDRKKKEWHAALIFQRCWYKRNNEWSTFLLLGCLREKENEEREFDSQVLAYKRNHMARSERKKEQEALDAWLAEEAKAHRIRLLYNVIRYPYVEEWDDEAQAYVYAIYSQIDDSTAPLDEDQQPFEQVPTRYYVTEKPIYTIEEEDKAIRIQAQTRRFLAQCHLQEMQRLNRRERRRAALEAEWDNSRQERAQFFTLKFQFQFRNNSHVSTWLGDRVKFKPPVHSAPTAVSPTKRGNGTKNVRWMGNPGCFERFHTKGKRSDHTFTMVEVPTEMPQEILALEEQVRVKRRRDAEMAEHEAKRLAAALLEEEGAATMKKVTKTRQKKTKKKKRSPVDAPDGKKICAVPLCRHRALVLDVPGVSFCPEHFTLQHALEVAGKDPLEAARLLTLVDNGGGRVVKSQKMGWRGLLPGNLFPRGHRDTKKPPKMKETSTSVQADSSTTTTT
ncbi:hypothetical protein JG687_00005095 [Phytophthora cactorum]|uniref:Uncharacterized protein n=1 Tax=Phytophthora cactorum TaxID=29920 RepID=A0A8T1URJ2_9STRA|nr:hypothetical protein JG687_00005095 [Phytophthora cactorum]